MFFLNSNIINDIRVVLFSDEKLVFVFCRVFVLRMFYLLVCFFDGENMGI